MRSVEMIKQLRREVHDKKKYNCKNISNLEIKLIIDDVEKYLKKYAEAFSQEYPLGETKIDGKENAPLRNEILKELVHESELRQFLSGNPIKLKEYLPSIYRVKNFLCKEEDIYVNEKNLKNISFKVLDFFSIVSGYLGWNHFVFKFIYANEREKDYVIKIQKRIKLAFLEEYEENEESENDSSKKFKDIAKKNIEVTRKGFKEVLENTKSIDEGIQILQKQNENKIAKVPISKILFFSFLLIIILTGVIYQNSFIIEKTSEIHEKIVPNDTISKNQREKIGSLFSKDSTKFRLLILPFQRINKCKKQTALYERQILERFDSIIKRDSLDMEIHYYSKLPYEEDKIYDYSNLLQEYNIDVVLWGGYEEVCGDKTSMFIKHTSNTSRFYQANKIYRKDGIGGMYKDGHSGTHILELASELKNGYTQGKVDNIIFWTLANYYFEKKDFKKSISTIQHILDEKKINPFHYSIAMSSASLINDSINNIKYAKEYIKGRWKKDGTLKEIFDCNCFKIPTIYDKLAWSIIALNTYDTKDYDFSLKISNKILESFPKDGFSWYLKGIVLEKLNKKKEAVSVFLKAVKNNYESDKLWLDLGTLYKDLGKSKQEYDAYRNALKINEKNDRALMGLSGYWFKENRMNFALRSINLAIKYNSKDSNYWAMKSSILSALGKDREAINCINRALKIDSLNLNVLTAKSLMYGKKRKYDLALKYAEKSILIDSLFHFGWFVKSTALLDLGKKEDALRAINKALKGDSLHAGYLVLKSSIYNEKKQLSKALKYIDKSLQIDSLVPFGWFEKSKILYNSNRKHEALIAVDKSLAIDPLNKEASFLRLKIIGNKSSTKELYKVLEPHKLNPNKLAYLANFYISKGEYEKALVYVNDALQMNPTCTQAWIAKAQAYYKLKRIKEAVITFNQMMKVVPESDKEKIKKIMSETIQ